MRLLFCLTLALVAWSASWFLGSAWGLTPRESALMAAIPFCVFFGFGVHLSKGSKPRPSPRKGGHPVRRASRCAAQNRGQKS